jgi:hypothetical protein
MRHQRPVYDMEKACRDEAQIDKRQQAEGSKFRENGWIGTIAAII